MALRKSTDYIVIHCSATRPSLDVGAKEIDRWHKDRGWQKIGYHYVIRRNGQLETGRKENEVGAHVKDFNEHSIGVCLVGGVHEDRLGPEANYTDEQWKTLERLIGFLKSKYQAAKVQGHRDFPDVKKACPSFDVADWLKKVGL